MTHITTRYEVACTDDRMWDDLWHGVIWAAFVTEARAAGGWPDSEAVKQRACGLYEAALKEKARRKEDSAAGCAESA